MLDSVESETFRAGQDRLGEPTVTFIFVFYLLAFTGFLLDSRESVTFS